MDEIRCSARYSSESPLASARRHYARDSLAESKRQPYHFAAQQHLAAQFADFLRARFPHHSRAQSRIAEGVDQRLHNLLAVFEAFAGKQRVLDRRTERQALDPLRRPIGGNLSAAHPPHLLGVGLEEDTEQALAKLVGDPVFKGLRVARRD